MYCFVFPYNKTELKVSKPKRTKKLEKGEFYNTYMFKGNLLVKMKG